MTPSNQTLHGPRRSLDVFFSDSATRHPDRSALVVDGRTWSYAELDLAAREIEAALRPERQPGQAYNIGVLYGRSVLSYASVIAIMRSNATYVPVSPKLPAERLLRIIADAQIRFLTLDASDALSDEITDGLRRAPSLQILVQADQSTTSRLHSLIQSCPQHHFRLVTAATSSPPEPYPAISRQEATGPAYIIYTSGSTGMPKGVAITHENACSCIEKLHEMFDTTFDDRFSQFSALSFDVSIADLFLCWKSGATLYVPSAAESLVPLSFAATHRITVWSSVPALANFLLKLHLLKHRALPHLRLSMFAGEALPVELTRAWAVAAPRSRIFNLYGPTECTIFATCYEYERQNGAHSGMVPIGLPLPGLDFMIVDDGTVLEAEEATGELWLSGDQLAMGYWNNPAATQAAFVQFPAHNPSAKRWYRTGDLVSYTAEVGLSFRGRLDRQVKLRGYRVELQEVESALREVTGSTLVAVIPLGGTGGICEKLVAYCDQIKGDELAVRTRCLSRIPAYMVPDRIFELSTFPLSDHGKVDYQTLAARARSQLHESLRA